MASIGRRRAALGTLLGAMASLAFAPDARAQDAVAGTTAAVNPMTQGTPVSRPPRTLAVGTDVFQQERIVTGPAGQTQLLFVDGSTVTIGPDAALTLDDFVYDPNAGTGKIAMTAATGLLRFVGGQISKDQEVTVRTPTAIIGVRGGIMLVSIAPGGATTATLLFGKTLRVAALADPGKVETIRRPGFSSTVSGSNAQPSTPERVTASTLSQLSQLEGTPGRTGGAPVQPTQAGIQTASAPATNAITATVTAGQQQQQTTTQNSGVTATKEAATVVQTAVTDTTPTQAVAAAAPGVQAQNSAATAPAAQTPTGSTTPTSSTTFVPNPRIAAFSVTNDPSLNSVIPFLINQNLPISNASISPLYIAYGNSQLGFISGTDNRQVGLQASLNISGTGVGQSSEIELTTLIFSNQSGPTSYDRPVYVTGGSVGTTRRSGNSGGVSVTTQGTALNSVSGSSFSDSSLGSTFSVDTSNTSFGTTTPATASAYVFQNATSATGSRVNYSFTDTLNSTTLPSGVGTSRTTQTLVGYSSALVETFDTATGNRTASNQNVGAIAVSTNATSNRVSSFVSLVPVTFSSTANSGSTQTLGLSYGSLTGLSNARTAFIDDNIFGARDTLSDNTANSTTSPVSTINNATVTGSNSTYFVSSAAAPPPASLLPAGVSYCQCQYVKWGFFGGEFDPSSSSYDILHLGTWVAGPQADPSLMPTSGVANYAGHAIGTVANANVSGTLSRYIAVGGFTGSFNFATQAGNIQINQFDGANYAASISASNRRDYVGTLQNVGGVTRSGLVAGSFYAGGGDPAAETGGYFTLGGSTYTASGIFVGAKR